MSSYACLVFMQDQAAGTQGPRQLLQPADGVGDVLEHVGCDHVVERRERRQRLVERLAGEDHVDVDDRGLVDRRILGMLAAQRFGGQEIGVQDRAFVAAHDGTAQRADLEPLARGHRQTCADQRVPVGHA